MFKRLIRTFDDLRCRKANYMQTFGSPCGLEVYKDLANFCRAFEPTFRSDAREHALLEGRREVFLRIQKHLGRSVEELLEEYGNIPVTIGEDDA